MILALSIQVFGQRQFSKTLEKQAIGELRSEFGDQISIKQARATGKVNFVRLDSVSRGGLAARRTNMSPNDVAMTFLRSYGRMFGLNDPDKELVEWAAKKDKLGGSHVIYHQTFNGLPIFGGVLITHFDDAGDLRSVNGTMAPDVVLDTKPNQTGESSSAAAVAALEAKFPEKTGIHATNTELQVFRTGMAQGVSGENHLVWQVDVTNDRDVHFLVFVDAHSGEIVDQITRTYNALDRRLYDMLGTFDIPASYPSSPFWSEGTAFPTGDHRADEIIAGSGETYDLYRNAFGRDSFDGLGGPMISFFNIDPSFQDATQDYIGNNAVVFFGNGFTCDDIVAHEWTHALTHFTDNLVYEWQPGALNEAYSDIFGETLDQINGRGLDSPGGRRTFNDDACTIYTQPTHIVRILAPHAIAGDHDAAFNTFAEGSPEITSAGIAGQVVEVNDGVGISSDGCSTPFVNASSINGKIAMIDATATPPENSDCTSITKVENAQMNGARAVILANDSSLGNAVYDFGCDCVVTSIPTVDVGKKTGDEIRGALRSGVTVSIFRNVARNHENSYKWLIGEETDLGAVRDMWNPTCFLHPGRVTDDHYTCTDFGDEGGVHFNSAIPNHTFALLVDGGNYNGQRITGIGSTKALHIYFRAMSVYQVPFTDFADHAEALEASAQDLLGVDLPDLRTGLPSGQRININDIRQLHAATVATELRKPPTQCNFRPLLGKNPPNDRCDDRRSPQTTIFADAFEGNPLTRWTVSREVSNPATFQDRNWSWVRDLPDGRRGKGFYAYDYEGGCNTNADQGGVLELASPAITIPPGLANGPHLSFDHWVAVEDGFDGGQLMISVNGGPFQLVDPTAFIYNAYNRSLEPNTITDNVRAGQPAFTGTDEGTLSGSWGTSIVDLSGYAGSGDTIRLRFDMSSDFCFGTGLGWYLDNVRVYACLNNRNH